MMLINKSGQLVTVQNHKLIEVNGFCYSDSVIDRIIRKFGSILRIENVETIIYSINKND